MSPDHWRATLGHEIQVNSETPADREGRGRTSDTTRRVNPRSRDPLYRSCDRRMPPIARKQHESNLTSPEFRDPGGETRTRLPAVVGRQLCPGTPHTPRDGRERQ